MVIVMNNILMIASILIFFIGLMGVVTQDNIIKTIISLSILELGVILFFLSINYDLSQTLPLLSEDISQRSDPLPQAMMITTIIIGISVTTIDIALLIIVNRKYDTYSWKEVRRLRKEAE